MTTDTTTTAAADGTIDMAALHAALADTLDKMRAATAAEPPDAISEYDREARIKAYQSYSAQLSGIMAAETDLLRRARINREKAEGVPKNLRGSTLGQEIGDARRTNTGDGNGFLQMAQIICHDMPEAWNAYANRGELTEEMAMGLAQELRPYPPETRRAIDQRLTGLYGKTSVRKLRHQAKAHAQALQPAIAEEQRQTARSRRTTQTGPSDDPGMAWFKAHLPAEDIAFIGQALDRAASTIMRTGDPRTRDQIKADIFVAWFRAAANGSSPTDDNAPAIGTKIMLNVIINADTLIGANDHPAQLADRTELTTAAHIRELIADPANEIFIRRIFQEPQTGELIAMETRSQDFSAAARRFMEIRDQNICQHPFCDRPAEENDHIQPRAEGGTGSVANGQRLCSMHNQSKQKIGWKYQRVPADPTAEPNSNSNSGPGMLITNPSGHTIFSPTLTVLPGSVPQTKQTTNSQKPTKPPRSQHRSGTNTPATSQINDEDEEPS